MATTPHGGFILVCFARHSGLVDYIVDSGNAEVFEQISGDIEQVMA